MTTVTGKTSMARSVAVSSGLISLRVTLSRHRLFCLFVVRPCSLGHSCSFCVVAPRRVVAARAFKPFSWRRVASLLLAYNGLHPSPRFSPLACWELPQPALAGSGPALACWELPQPPSSPGASDNGLTTGRHTVLDTEARSSLLASVIKMTRLPRNRMPPGH